LEQEMKIASTTVRRLRTDRGWSQEQLATASGLSLRTIQRVEAEGAASMSTRVSLAATFSVALAELSADTVAGPAVLEARPWRDVVGLFLGLAILGCVMLAESGRMVGLPTSTPMAAINLLLGVVGLAVTLPCAWRLVAQRRQAGVALAVLGTPLVTLTVCALVIAIVAGRMPTSGALVFGLGGAVLVGMALRQFRIAPVAAG
jgi:DNA-binding XRE family transcriptional regulator